jgi:hypothetical protein
MAHHQPHIIAACAANSMFEKESQDRLGRADPANACVKEEPTTMADIESLPAYWLDCNTLVIDECPYCRHQHYHVPKPSPYRDIRVANCEQRHLKKKLRRQVLFHRLRVMRGPDDGPGEVIAFPKPRARGAPPITVTPQSAGNTRTRR